MFVASFLLSTTTTTSASVSGCRFCSTTAWHRCPMRDRRYNNLRFNCKSSLSVPRNLLPAGFHTGESTPLLTTSLRYCSARKIDEILCSTQQRKTAKFLRAKRQKDHFTDCWNPSTINAKRRTIACMRTIVYITNRMYRNAWN